jgi:acyl dehydratase
MTVPAYEAAPSFDEIQVGQELPSYERTPTKAQLVMYAGAEDDYMPVHFDHQYAVAAGQPGVINHGWLTYAVLLQAVTSWLPPEAADIIATNCRYVRPAFPEQAIVCHGTVTAKSEQDGAQRIEVALTATNPAGETTTRAGVTLQFA